MFINHITITTSVLLEIASSSGGSETLLLSLGEWKRVNRALGYDPDAGLLLSEGTPVDEAMYDALRLAAEKTGALQAAARMLSVSAVSASSLLRKLAAKGFSPDAARSAVSLLERRGLLDDAAACRNYAESAVRNKRHGRRRIVEYLVYRGFPQDAARDAAASVPDGQYREALLWQLRRKFPELAKDPASADRAEKQKAVAAMMRLGFEAEEVLAAMKEITEDA